MCTGSHEALEKPLTQQQQGLENTPPPPGGEYQPISFWEKI
jgi:hypothetical protein